jgi:hypothetical protein
VVLRTLLALVLIAVGTIGYGHIVGQIELPWLAAVGDRLSAGGPSVSDRAILFDGGLSDQKENQILGTAVWRTTFEPLGQGGGQVAVLLLEAEIPERKLALRLSMRPDPGGGAISHLMELRFLLPDRKPDDAIVRIAGVMTRTSEITSRAMLSGSVVAVAPGVFLFGLAGDAAARALSMQQLKTMRWLDVPLTYRNGASGVLTIERGKTGGPVVSEVLSKWEG